MNKDEALDLALEALEYASSYCDTYDAIAAIKQARALDKKAENARELGLDYEPAPVQEPVATIDSLEQEIYENTREFVSLNVMEWLLNRLNTTPPAAQRQWVGLTDEEVGDLSDFAYANDEEFVRNVEAKLKEKNA